MVSPDGTRVAMTGAVGGVPKLWIAQVQDSWFTPGKAPEPIAMETFADTLIAGPWSPDAKSIGGFAFTAQGLIPATYTLASRRVAQHQRLGASVAFGWEWLPDSRRILYWDVLRNTAVVSDLDARETKDIPGIPGPSELKLSGDGRTLMVNRMILEGDVWLLTLK
jgi:hypothetical protein